MSTPASFRANSQVTVTPSEAVTGGVTEGQRRLAELDAKASEIAAVCRVSRPAVSQWKAGKKVPAPAARELLEKRYGIPRITWERPAGWAADAPVTPRAVAPSDGNRTPRPVTDSASSTPTTLEEVLARIEELATLAQNEDLTPSERLKLEDTRVKYYTLAHRIIRDRELSEEKIVRRHPLFERVARTILVALRPWPDAMRAVAAALRDHVPEAVSSALPEASDG